MPALYLIPVPLGDTPLDRVLPPQNAECVRPLRHFIVEDVRSARRFLRRLVPDMVIDDRTFYELNGHTPPEQVSTYLQPMADGHSMGVISEAGCPAVADPGADVVAMAQRQGYRVVPMVGPSSILLSLMASGMNGQSFAFVGYLPIEPGERTRRIRQLESRALSEGQTQIFIETPYRNNRLAEELVRTLRPATRLGIAVRLTCDDEQATTRTASEWRGHIPDLGHRPCIFLIGK